MDSQPSEPLPIDIAQYSKLSEARERGLVLSATGITHTIIRSGAHWNLRVDLQDVTRAMQELVAYEEELRLAEPPEAPGQEAGAAFWSLPLAALCMVLAAVVQAESGAAWMEAGILSSERMIQQGEWWRALTALTLHGDVPHVVANLWVGLLLGGLLIPAFGQGLTWLSVLLAGALGNILTALAYFPHAHRSLGASTAVFGALGLLVGDSLGRILQKRSGRSWWRWVVPLGAGLSLLAYLGSGEGKVSVDVMAHLWGFAAGLPMGLVICFCKPRQRLSGWMQIAAGLAAPGILMVAWTFARLRSGAPLP